MEERRKYKRFEVAMEVKYTIEGWNEQFTCKTRNIGGGGICLVVDSALKDKTPLEVELPPVSPEFTEPITVRAETVWSKNVNELRGEYQYSFESSHLPPWMSPYAAPVVGGSEDPWKRFFLSGVKFTGIDSSTIVKIIRYISAYVSARVQPEAIAKDRQSASA